MWKSGEAGLGPTHAAIYKREKQMKRYRITGDPEVKPLLNFLGGLYIMALVWTMFSER